MGRKVLKQEIPESYHSQLNHKKIIKIRGMKVKGNKVYCNRCASVHLKSECHIHSKQASFYYCPNCLILGRVESRSFLYSLSEKSPKKRDVKFTWEGQLTKAQKKIANNLIAAYKKQQNHLVHAVTGAGKTEMLFPLLLHSLKRGGRIAVVSPRVDVCLELLPRFQEAFSDEKIMLLYGGKEESYNYTPFVVATTHQLLRFSRAFDLIVVDEVDAFPYANNPVLEHGVKTSLKEKGVLVYLTATPSKELQKSMTSGELGSSYLPRRFHGHQLPVPECHFDYFLIRKLNQKKLSDYFLTILKQQKRQCLIFFPNIKRMISCQQKMKELFPEKRIAYVYAGKDDREELIMAMRNKEVDWLLTTTILERGVTFPNIDVIVFEADHRVFNTASLVQISGRVGRKKEYPTGHVYFLHTGKTKSIKQAIHQIKSMNERAGF